MVNITNANFKAVSIEGKKISATPNNTICNMEFDLKKAFLFNEKSLVGNTNEVYTVACTNEYSVKEDIAVPEIYLDVNNVGQVYFIMIRPFTIQRKLLFFFFSLFF